MLLATTGSDLRRKVAGSMLGLGWYALYPLLLLAAYAAVYIYVFNVRLKLFDSKEYVLVIFCGLVPFLAFAEALASGSASVTGNSGLIKNTLFPIDLIPVKAVLATQAVQVVSLSLLLLALACFGKLSLWAVLVAPLWGLQILFTLGCVWILAAMNVFLRDVQHSLGVVVLLLMMVSPIAYTDEMVSGPLRLLLKFNPLYYVIVCYRECLIFGRPPRIDQWLPLAILAPAAFCGGYVVFRRLKPVFSDHV